MEGPLGTGWLSPLDVLERFRELEGGEERNFQSSAVAASDGQACGDSGRKGPSRALAGDADLLPGMVSSVPLVAGGEEWRARRISRCTEDVSQLSNALSIDVASPAGKAVAQSEEDLADPLNRFVFDDPGPTLVEDEFRREEDRLRLVLGVLGGELRVTSCDWKERLLPCVRGPTSSIGGILRPKLRCSWPTDWALSTRLVHRPTKPKTAVWSAAVMPQSTNHRTSMIFED